MLAAAADADRARYDQRLLEQRHAMAQEAEAARHAAIAHRTRRSPRRAPRSPSISRIAAKTVARQVDEARRALVNEAEQVAAEMLARVARSGRA